MTDKQKMFLQSYLTHFNATQAAIDAGYAEASAKVAGCRLLTYDNIKKEKDKFIKEIIAKSDDKRAFLINFWIGIINNTESSESARLKASELLGKYLGTFIEKLEVNNTIQFVRIDKDDESL